MVLVDVCCWLVLLFGVVVCCLLIFLVYVEHIVFVCLVCRSFFVVCCCRFGCFVLFVDCCGLLVSRVVCWLLSYAGWVVCCSLLCVLVVCLLLKCVVAVRCLFFVGCRLVLSGGVVCRLLLICCCCMLVVASRCCCDLWCLVIPLRFTLLCDCLLFVDRCLILRFMFMYRGR